MLSRLSSSVQTPQNSTPPIHSTLVPADRRPAHATPLPFRVAYPTTEQSRKLLDDIEKISERRRREIPQDRICFKNMKTTHADGTVENELLFVPCADRPAKKGWCRNG